VFVGVVVGRTCLRTAWNGTILGTVKDTSGGVVAGASVTARNNDTGFTRTVTTEADGSYRLNAIPIEPMR